VPNQSGLRAVEHRPLRILATEDNPSAREVLSRHLDHEGLDLTFAHDGAQAVEALALEAFDVVLMDLSMPVMDGLEAIRLIRASEAHEGRTATPILAVSARTSPEDVQACLAAGADDHLGKPVSRMDLLTRVLQLASRL